MKKQLKWNSFRVELGPSQQLPEVGKDVLVLMKSKGAGYPQGVAVGYLKNGGGDPNCPHFIVPGLHTGEVLAWSDSINGVVFPVTLG